MLPTPIVLFIVTLASVFLIAVFGHLYVRKRQRDRLRADFADREPMSAEEFGDRYFNGSEEERWVAMQLRDFLANRCQVDAARIRPDDALKKLGIRFAKNYDLAWSLEAKFGLHFGGSEVENLSQLDEEIETFRDLVQKLMEAQHTPWPIEESAA